MTSQIGSGRVTAVLGPTNTGKTHYAVDRMLGHATGMIGFPLRLLAREIYDRVVAIKGQGRVALLTGEEKIVPSKPAYWVCTVESMPLSQRTDFLAVDEIQLAADWQRGHVFTDRLLHARGRFETLFMGADTIGPLIRRLLPDATIMSRTRFSRLRYIKPHKLTRLPRRSAIVAFSAENVYGLAELMRRNRGGAAVVMGALSPRTRNAQVALYQSGDVDYLVATDAIGMGLNMDIDHVAFAATYKFDGQTVRSLTAPEVAQIAGRAGRHMSDGTFSTIAGPDGCILDPQVIEAVESHEFRSLKTLFWRNARLDYGSVSKLIASLEIPTDRPGLVRAQEAPDLWVLKALGENESIRAIASNPAAVQRLWDVCQIPDFRRLSPRAHLSLLRRIYQDLMGRHGVVPHDWMARQVSRLDNVQGDIDTLAARIASIRTWTYVANRRNWVKDAAHWAHVTRGIEDKLSDALHERLTQRFVDRRTSVLMRELRQRGELSVSIDETNEIIVEGHAIGVLDGFTFRADPSAVGAEFKTLEQAADVALKAEMTRRAKIFCNVGYKTLSLDTQQGIHRPRLIWRQAVIATIEKGNSPLEPRVVLAPDSMLRDKAADDVREKCAQWLSERIADKLEPLLKLKEELDSQTPSDEVEAPLQGLARGVAFRLLEHWGVLSRSQVAHEIRQIDQDARKGLRRFQIRIGSTALYIPLVLKPHAVELRLILWALWNGITDLPAMPTPGLVWIATEPSAPREFYEIAGFRLIGGHEGIRLDMLERLADAVRPLGQGSAQFTVTPEIMGLVGCSGESFIRAMRAIGYDHEVHKVPAPVKETPDAEGTPRPDGKPAMESASGAIPDTNTNTNTNTNTYTGVGVAMDAHVGDLPVADANSAGADSAAEGGHAVNIVAGPSTIAQAAPDQEATAADEATGDASDDISGTPASSDISDAGVATADNASAEPELVDEVRFKWAPRQGRVAGNSRPRRARQAKADMSVPAAGKNAKGKGRSKAAGGQKGNGRTAQDGRQRKRRETAPPANQAPHYNEDSPFAQLKALKDALEKKA